MRIILPAGILIGLMFIYMACKKYEYGPSLSLRSKKNRIANTWIIELVKKNGYILSSRPRSELSIKKDGTITKTDTLLNAAGLDSIIRKSGLWEFDNQAENVLVLFANRYGIEESHIWYILKLTNDEFWYEETDSLHLFEYRLKTK